MRGLLVLLLAVGCDGFPSRLGNGPVCVPADANPAPTCDATLAVLQMADAAFGAADMQEVRFFVHLTWVPGPDFISPDGRHLWGHAEPRLRADVSGFTICDLEVATRDQDRVSATSVVHEALHCAVALSGDELDGDPNHSNPVWRPCGDAPAPRCGLLASINADAAAAGL